MDSVKVYAALIGVSFLVLWAARLYYFPRYKIGDSRTFYKGKLSKNNILIKLGFFKYNDNANWFLLIPYLLAWILFIATLIAYIVYWSGVEQLVVFFTSKWVGIFIIQLFPLYLAYEAILNIIYTSSGNLVINKPDFKVEEKKDEKNKD